MAAFCRRKSLTTLLVTALTMVGVVAACGGGDGADTGSQFPGGDGGGGLGDATIGGGDGSMFGSDGSGSGGGDGSGGNLPGSDASFACDGCAPFPQGAPPCAPAVLANPQLAYPLDGMLLPPNMNVLEVQFVPPQGATLFEVDFTNSITNVRVETQCNPVPDVRQGASRGCGLTLPQAAWTDIANQNRDGDPVKVTVRATIDGSCVSSSQEQVAVAFAKEDLAGGIYYWQSATYGGIAGTTGGIFSHDFGSFDPTPTPFYTSGSSGTCVGCHTLSRDGVRMALMTDDPDADDEYGDVHTHVMDVATRTVLGGAMVGAGFQTFTHDHAKMIASTWKQGNKTFGVWSGDGTTAGTAQTLPSGVLGTQPNLSKSDTSLVFVNPTALSMAGDHHFTSGALWSATFDPNAGTLSNYAAFLTPTGTQTFFYPDQSPDGSWVILNESDDNTAANNTNDAFYNRKARVKLLHFPPQQGDKPLDLTALNVADGLSNSWPRWSPFVQTYKNHKILWVTFSSNRDYGLHLVNKGFDNYYPPESPAYDQPQPASKQNVMFNDYAAPQIWMAAIVIDTDRALDATDRSYPAFWLPFQDVTAHNHSAQWVEKVQAPPGQGDGGAGGDGGSGGDAGDDGGGGMCGEMNAACNPGLCCSDMVCCAGSCQPFCLK